MKYISETKALRRLQKLKDAYAALIRGRYEHRAKDCATCDAKGSCCLDAHFVNVHITRLEAAAIKRVIGSLPNADEIYERIGSAIERYSLEDERDSFAKTYACPLFDPYAGCLVHREGKPLPCITHACYEKEEDLPPDRLQQEHEREVEALNESVYGEVRWLPIPVAIRSEKVVN